MSERFRLLKEFRVTKKMLESPETSLEDKVKLAAELLAVTKQICEIWEKDDRYELVSGKLFPEWFHKIERLT